MNSAMRKKSSGSVGSKVAMAFAVAGTLGVGAVLSSMNTLHEDKLATVQKEGKTVRVEIKPGIYWVNPLTTSFIKWKDETKSVSIPERTLDRTALLLKVSADYIVPDTYHMEEYTTFNHLFNTAAAKAANKHIGQSMWRDIAGEKDFLQTARDICSDVAGKIPSTREGDVVTKATKVTCELSQGTKTAKVVLARRS